MPRPFLVLALALALALGLGAACTIFDGLTPEPDASSDAHTDHASVSSCGDAEACTSGQGLCAPQPTCMAAAPCQHGFVYTVEGGLSDQEISNPIDTPTCKTDLGTQDPILSWADSVTGATRYACSYRPPLASGPLPLVVFFHPLGGSADDIYKRTGLRDSAPLTNLGDGAGFVLASDQGENLVSVSTDPSGASHDFYYRNFTVDSGSINPDFRAADYLIDTLVTTEHVDTSRIYLMGWGEGAFFAEAYGIVRNVTPTPGGNRVAAAAVYAGADPFQTPTSAEANCTLAHFPSTHLPIEIVHRACSLIACNGAESQVLGSPPGYDVEDWLTALRTIDTVPPTDQIIDVDGFGVDACAPTTGSILDCTHAVATELGNMTWPGGSVSSMLAFLKSHPLPP
jgi:hypothetical protein